jgi:3-deoxy-7-phosphoheptulonate synthase
MSTALELSALVGETAGPPRDRRGVAVLAVAAGATDHDVRMLVDHLRAAGVEASVHHIGTGVVILRNVSAGDLDALIGGSGAFERAWMPDTRYHLARREVAPAGTVVSVGGVPFGGDAFTVVAGPCAVENRAQVLSIARAVAASGAAVLRGGGFKPRTSPHDFQGLGLPGVALLAEARAATGLPFITEILSAGMIEAMYGLVDGFQVGARNMQNFELLKALGAIDKPVLLKRNPGATVEEWLLAAEYLLAGGNDRVILCERGIRTFNTTTRYTLDLATVALVKRETHLPVIVDPSHGTGDPALISPMALAALAAGADGVIVEVHTDPGAALSDGYQALRPAELAQLVGQLAALAVPLGRRLSTAPVVGPGGRDTRPDAP